MDDDALSCGDCYDIAHDEMDERDTCEEHAMTDDPDDPDDLVTWLRAQLDEDERVARAATCEAWRVTTRSAPGQPYSEAGEIYTAATHARYPNDKSPESYRVVTHGDFHEAVDLADAEHIARHDPARVLREVEAKRRIIDLHDAVHECSGPEGGGLLGDYAEEPCPTLRLLALPYADRAGYRDEWRP